MEARFPLAGVSMPAKGKKHLVIIGVYPRSSAPDSLAIPFRFSSFVNCYTQRPGVETGFSLSSPAG
jgi:hypothetical protein